jgi:hypothetical protein
VYAVFEDEKMPDPKSFKKVCRAFTTTVVEPISLAVAQRQGIVAKTKRVRRAPTHPDISSNVVPDAPSQQGAPVSEQKIDHIIYDEQYQGRKVNPKVEKVLFGIVFDQYTSIVTVFVVTPTRIGYCVNTTNSDHDFTEQKFAAIITDACKRELKWSMIYDDTFRLVSLTVKRNQSIDSRATTICSHISRPHLSPECEEKSPPEGATISLRLQIRVSGKSCEFLVGNAHVLAVDQNELNAVVQNRVLSVSEMCAVYEKILAQPHYLNIRKFDATVGCSKVKEYFVSDDIEILKGAHPTCSRNLPVMVAKYNCRLDVAIISIKDEPEVLNTFSDELWSGTLKQYLDKWEQMESELLEASEKYMQEHTNQQLNINMYWSHLTGPSQKKYDYWVARNVKNMTSAVPEYTIPCALVSLSGSDPPLESCVYTASAAVRLNNIDTPVSHTIKGDCGSLLVETTRQNTHFPIALHHVHCRDAESSKYLSVSLKEILLWITKDILEVSEAGDVHLTAFVHRQVVSINNEAAALPPG